MMHMDNVESNLPDIRSSLDVSLCEVNDYETGKFLRSTFAYIDKDDTAWFGEAPGITKFKLTLEDIKRYLKRVPDHKIYPLATSTITALQQTNQDIHYIKRPKLFCLDDPEETKLLPRLLLEEAEVLEVIEPHPNLTRYYGCIIKDGRVIGIVLQRHPIILQYRYKDDPRDLDIGAVMKGIRAGVDHLHSQGLAHNDLNPNNIGLDKEDNPIIFDFGSCRKFGAQLISAGTPGWIDEDYDTSSQTHDEVGIKKLEGWLLRKQSEREANKRFKQNEDQASTGIITDVPN